MSTSPPRTRSGKPRRARPVHGLYTRNFPRVVRWKIDQDYLDQLSPAEQEWLSAFNDQFYNAKFEPTDTDTDPAWNTENRREAYRDKNRANRDAMSITEVTHALDYISETQRDPEARPADQSPTPDYLNDPAYKTALANYRAQLHPSRNHLPEPSPELDAARRALEDFHGQDQDPLPAVTPRRGR